MKKSGNQRFQEGLYRVLRVLLLPAFTFLFKAKADKSPVIQPPFMVVANHVTDYDFFYPAKVIRQPLGFVVGEGLLQNRWLRKLLIDGLGCISKRKATKDIHTVSAIFRRLKNGRSVCLFVEGNTTFDGVTGPFSPAIGKLFGLVDAGLVTLRIEGGYFLKPRWGKGLRRGKTACRIVNVYTKEELKSKNADEVNAILKKDLFEDAYLRQESMPVRYKSRRKAEGIEHAAYLCPVCEAQSSIYGKKNQVICNECGTEAEFTDFGFIEGGFPHKTLREWLSWQREQLKSKMASAENPLLLSDERQTLFMPDEQGKMRTKAEGKMLMDRETLSIGDFAVKIKDIAGLEIYRKNVIQFSTMDGQYCQTGKTAGLNALKYRDLYEIIKAGD
ncbi:MAG: lysophospholipid acyltransferase family protein [Bacillota bacterium]|nr:lysophospholipid acyltransferase family protein [Bacillota bacterium]